MFDSKALVVSRFSQLDVWLIAILLSAAVFRLVGIDSGLPLALNGDETTVVEHALALNWNDLNPHVFMYGSLTFVVFKIAIVAASPIIGFLTNRPPVLSDYYLLCRVLSAAFGTASVYLVYEAGKLLAGRAVGLTSAGLMAWSPLAVQLAHNATVDSMMGFWACLSLVGVAQWLHGSSRGMIVASISAGLAMATKYNAAMLLIPLVLTAIQLRDRQTPRSLSRLARSGFSVLILIALISLVAIVLARESILGIVTGWTTNGRLQPIYVQMFDRLVALSLVFVLAGVVLWLGIVLRWRWATAIVQGLMSKHLTSSTALVCVTFVVASPFVLLDFPSFTRDFFFQLNKNVTGGIASFESGSRSYIAAVASLSPGDPFQYVGAIAAEWSPLVLVAIVLGAGVLCRVNLTAWISFVPAVVLMTVMTTTWAYFALRYLYQFWLLFAVLGGIGIWRAAGWLVSLVQPVRYKHRLAVSLTVLILLPGMFSSLNLIRSEFLLIDTRTLAAAWIEKNIPRGTTILREWETPPLEQLGSQFKVYSSDAPFEKATLSQWQSRQVTVILLGDRNYRFYQDHADLFQDVLDEYSALKSTWRLATSFEPGKTVKGSLVQIYLAPQEAHK